MSQLSVFVVGDSISMHYGPFLEAAMQPVMRYARKTGEEAALQGTPLAGQPNGGDSSLVLAYLEAMRRADALQADILILNCGLHDIKTSLDNETKQVPLALYTENLHKIIALGRETAGQLIWVRTTPVNDAMHNENGKRGFYRYNADIDAYNAVADRLMDEAGIRIIDLHGFTRTLTGDIYADGVHFLESVRARQAAYIAGYLSCLLHSVTIHR